MSFKKGAPGLYRPPTPLNFPKSCPPFAAARFVVLSVLRAFCLHLDYFVCPARFAPFRLHFAFPSRAVFPPFRLRLGIRLPALFPPRRAKARGGRRRRVRGGALRWRRPGSAGRGRKRAGVPSRGCFSAKHLAVPSIVANFVKGLRGRRPRRHFRPPPAFANLCRLSPIPPAGAGHKKGGFAKFLNRPIFWKKSAGHLLT